MMTRMRTIGLALFTLCLVPAGAQELIQANTRLVQVNVLAQDSKGHPIGDLTREDFVLEVDGRRRPIQLFTIERNAESADAVRPPSELPFSNRSASGDPNLVIVLFDEYNTHSMDAARARKQLVDIFSRLPNSRIALYVLTTELKILLDFTTDHAALRAKLAAHAPLPSFATESPELDIDVESKPESLASALKAESIVSDARNAHSAEVTLDALNMICAHVSGLPGRKTLVWLTAGIPVLIGYDPASLGAVRAGQRNLSPDVIRTARALERADISVDVVDLRGVRADDQGNQRDLRREMPLGSTGLSPFAVDAAYESMMTIARETGGEVFRNTNDIGHALKRAIDDSQVSYALGFYPSQDELDGSFRKLGVHVARRGVHVRYRQGFFATPDPPPQNLLSQPLEQLVSARVSLSAISLRAELYREPQGSYKLTVHAGPDGMVLRDEGGKWTGDFEWLAAAGRNGVYSNQRRKLHVALRAEAYREFMMHGLAISQSVAWQEGDTELGIAIRDVSTGVAGTLRLYRRAPDAGTAARH